MGTYIPPSGSLDLEEIPVKSSWYAQAWGLLQSATRAGLQRFSFAASLRTKITLTHYLVGTAFIGVALFSFAELQSIEHTAETRRLMTEFFDEVRALRSAEKNLLLYRKQADFKDAQRHLQTALAQIDSERERFAELGSDVQIDAMRTELELYGPLLVEYWNTLRARPAVARELEEGVKELRSSFVEAAEGFASAAERKLDRELGEHRWNLVASIVILTLLVIVAGQWISFRVVRPLRDMEVAMQSVGSGRLKSLSLPTRDQEIASLTRAFNHVLSQLETRQKEMVRTEKLASLGTMLSGVAHELNNPLSNISTTTQILLEELPQVDAATLQTMLGQVDGETERARRIVRSLLDFAQQRAFRLEQVALRPLVDDTLQLLVGPVLEQMVVEVDVPPGLAVAADRSRMQQVLFNLVKNAAEACGDTGRLLIRARRSEGGDDAGGAGSHLPGPHLDLVVQDSGPGIDAALLPRVFDPFFTTKDVGRGTGLGLFVAHRIVSEHGGRIAVDNAPDGGARFTLCLPLPGKEDSPS